LSQEGDNIMHVVGNISERISRLQDQVGRYFDCTNKMADDLLARTLKLEREMANLPSIAARRPPPAIIEAYKDFSDLAQSVIDAGLMPYSPKPIFAAPLQVAKSFQGTEVPAGDYIAIVHDQEDNAVAVRFDKAWFEKNYTPLHGSPVQTCAPDGPQGLPRR
jgi:hypothetical protein